MAYDYTAEDAYWAEVRVAGINPANEARHNAELARSAAYDRWIEAQAEAEAAEADEYEEDGDSKW